MQENLIAEALDVAKGKEAVQLTYWRNQEQYDALGLKLGCYTIANANAWLIAWELANMGVSVSFVYPDNPFGTVLL